MTNRPYPPEYTWFILIGLYETASIIHHLRLPKTIEEHEKARQKHYNIMNILIDIGAVEVK